ncbi:hypothetical protein TH25_08150 [Thalassospira profundimaris]|uniref:2Fe-2S ferredoxin-type domain-containing protein n=1 Tax=Thalassospira profundimaris TaxID=502049 RepID=A0A367XDE8_9PROT|nr:2Fe-2S iron-sulfur cluster-binding protein [Thalassospira profundimaris]RCK51654.1 hypothetical protein TH25_08150 [Thalassospira profundimaris]
MARQPVEVEFAKGGKTATWNPNTAPSLLELAEETSLTPEFGCRNGSCDTCQVNILQGKVTYEKLPSASPEAGTALLCCARPAAADEGKNSQEQTPLILDV